MATDAFAQVIIGAALAEALQPLQDSIACLQIEAAEFLADLEQEAS